MAKTKVIPVLYHITDLKNLKGIKLRGLLPGDGELWLFGSRARADDMWRKWGQVMIRVNPLGIKYPYKLRRIAKDIYRYRGSVLPRYLRVLKKRDTRSKSSRAVFGV